MKYLFIAFSLISGVTGQFFFKEGVQRAGLEISEISLSTIFDLVKIFFTPYVFIGLVFYGLSTVSWMAVLSKFPLSIAYPILSLGYIAVMIIGKVKFGEPITFVKVTGTLLILTGVVLLFVEGKEA